MLTKNAFSGEKRDRVVRVARRRFKCVPHYDSREKMGDFGADDVENEGK